jgi:hypothetical protein
MHACSHTPHTLNRSVVLSQAAAVGGVLIAAVLAMSSGPALLQGNASGEAATAVAATAAAATAAAGAVTDGGGVRDLRAAMAVKQL